MNLVPIPDKLDRDSDVEQLFLARRRSPETARSYECALRRFHDWFPGAWNEVTLLVLEKYQRHLAQSAKYETVKQRMAVIKSFLTFAASVQYLPFNVGAAIVPLDDLDEPPQWEPMDVSAMLARIPEAHWEKRLAVRMLYEAGCRIGELLAVQFSDLTPALAGMNQAWLRLRKCKGRKKRTVCVDEEWLAIFDSLAAMGFEKPFRFTQDWYRKLLRQYCGTHPHNFRHQHAYDATDADVPDRVLQRQMGHEDIRVTRRYQHMRPKYSSGAYLQLPPVSSVVDMKRVISEKE
jgi:integrase